MYKLNYQEHNKLKQIAYLIMQKHNNNEYHSNKQNKQFIKYNQTIYLLYKQKTKDQLLDLIDRYQKYLETQEDTKQIELNQRNIIIPKLKTVTNQQLEHIIIVLKDIQEKYYLDIDINYEDKYSILEAYQQLLYYKHYNIELPINYNNMISIGNTELLEKGIL